jgi:hypothetical protein
MQGNGQRFPEPTPHLVAFQTLIFVRLFKQCTQPVETSPFPGRHHQFAVPWYYRFQLS